METTVDPVHALEAGVGTWLPHPHPFVFEAQAQVWCVGRTVYAVIAHIPACDYYFVRVGNEQNTLRAQNGESAERLRDRLKAWCETRIEMGCATPLSLPIARPSTEDAPASPLARLIKKPATKKRQPEPEPRPEAFVFTGVSLEMMVEVAMSKPS